MKLKISPLNIATAFFLFLTGYVWLYGAKITGVQFVNFTGTVCLIFLLFAFVIFVLDIMLRNFFQEAKKLWIIELSFIAFATILFLLIR